jgi:hypothetical protein
MDLLLKEIFDLNNQIVDYKLKVKTYQREIEDAKKNLSILTQKKLNMELELPLCISALKSEEEDPNLPDCKISICINDKIRAKDRVQNFSKMYAFLHWMQEISNGPELDEKLKTAFINLLNPETTRENFNLIRQLTVILHPDKMDNKKVSNYFFGNLLWEPEDPGQGSIAHIRLIRAIVDISPNTHCGYVINPDRFRELATCLQNSEGYAVMVPYRRFLELQHELGRNIPAKIKIKETQIERASAQLQLIKESDQGISENIFLKINELSRQLYESVYQFSAVTGQPQKSLFEAMYVPHTIELFEENIDAEMKQYFARQEKLKQAELNIKQQEKQEKMRVQMLEQRRQEEQKRIALLDEKEKKQKEMQRITLKQKAEAEETKRKDAELTELLKKSTKSAEEQQREREYDQKLQEDFERMKNERKQAEMQLQEQRLRGDEIAKLIAKVNAEAAAKRIADEKAEAERQEAEKLRLEALERDRIAQEEAKRLADEQETARIEAQRQQERELAARLLEAQRIAVLEAAEQAGKQEEERKREEEAAQRAHQEAERKRKQEAEARAISSAPVVFSNSISNVPASMSTHEESSIFSWILEKMRGR